MRSKPTFPTKGHVDKLPWAGGVFDSNGFDLNRLNRDRRIWATPIGAARRCEKWPRSLGPDPLPVFFAHGQTDSESGSAGSTLPRIRAIFESRIKKSQRHCGLSSDL